MLSTPARDPETQSRRLEYAYARSDPAFQRQLRRSGRPWSGTFETGSGLQTQVDWAHLGLRPLGDQMVELYAGGLGCSWAPAIRFATDLIRPTSLERLAACLDVD
jgi:hypothetical protein